MTANPIQHVWSSEALFTKALLYVGEMERYTTDDWQFGLWSSLSLELIARAALSHISPTLLASRKDWRNIHHALGHAPTKTDLLRLPWQPTKFYRSFVKFCLSLQKSSPISAGNTQAAEMRGLIAAKTSSRA